MAKKVVVEEKGGGGESGSGRWMLTYLDMVTLLFGVFVILYAMSKIDEQKAQAVAEAIRLGFQGGTSVDVGPMSGGRTILEDMLPEGVTRRRVRNRAMALFRQEIVAGIVHVSETEMGVAISLVGSDNFSAGSARLGEQTEEILRKAAPFLGELEYMLRIEGHTDQADSELNFQHEYYETGWELSSQRSINVLRFLQSLSVNPDKMSAVAFADTRPVDTAGTPEANAANRRVDIEIVTGERYRPRRVETPATSTENAELRSERERRKKEEEDNLSPKDRFQRELERDKEQIRARPPGQPGR